MLDLRLSALTVVAGMVARAGVDPIAVYRLMRSVKPLIKHDVDEQKKAA